MTTAGASYAGGNDATISVQISIDGPNVTAQRNRIGAAGNYPYQVVEGRVDGDSIRASNKFCTLSLTRDPASRQTAASAYDGTYALSMAPLIATGVVTFTLRVTKGSGLLAISKAGCSDSQFDVIISSAGEVSGQGDLKCIVGTPAAAGLTGPLTIGGRIADRKAALRLFSNRSDYSILLPLSAN